MGILVIDNNSDLDLSQINQFGIEHINMPFSYCNDKVEVYKNALRPYLLQNNNVIYLSSGKDFCDTYSDLKRAVRSLKTEYSENTINVVDTLIPSCGYSFVLFSAMLKYKTDCGDLELINHIQKVRNEVMMLFSTDTKTLINLGVEVFDNPLIRPIAKIEDNEIKLVDKVTNKKKLIEYFVDYMEKNGENIADYSLFISESEMGSEVEELKTLLQIKFGNEIRIYIQKSNEYNINRFGKKHLAVAFHKRIES